MEPVVKDWLLFIGPLLGVMIGTFVSSIAKYFEVRSLRKFELDKLRINKIEELCLELGILRTMVSKCGEAVQLELNAGKSGTEIQTVYVPYYETISRSIERIRVLNSNYHGCAQPVFDELKMSWNKVMDALFETAFKTQNEDLLQTSIKFLKEKSLELQTSTKETTLSILKSADVKTRN